VKSVPKNRNPNAVERKIGEEKGKHHLAHPESWASPLKCFLISKIRLRSRLMPMQEAEGRAQIESLPFEGKRESYDGSLYRTDHRSI